MVDYIKDDQPDNPYREVHILSHHTDIVRHLVHIDGSRCASAGDDNLAVIWDIKFGRKLHVLEGHSRPVTCLCVLPADDENYAALLTASSDKIIIIWDIDLGTCLHKLSQHQSTARCLLAVKQGNWFCSGGDRLCLWNRYGALLGTLSRGQQDDIQQLLAVQENRIVGVTDKELVVYSLPDGANLEVSNLRLMKRLAPHREAIKSLVKVTDECFASGSLDGAIVLWTVRTFTSLCQFNYNINYEGSDKLFPYSVQHMICLQNRYLLAAIGAGFALYDLVSGKVVAEKTQAHFSKILNLCFVYDGFLLATSSEDGNIRLWGSAIYTTTCDNRSSKTYPEETMERFLGVSAEQLKKNMADQKKIEPQLIGECVAHSGAVQLCLNVGDEGFISCGVDGAVILWKDETQQCFDRNRLVLSLLQRNAGIG